MVFCSSGFRLLIFLRFLFGIIFRAVLFIFWTNLFFNSFLYFIFLLRSFLNCLFFSIFFRKEKKFKIYIFSIEILFLLEKMNFYKLFQLFNYLLTYLTLSWDYYSQIFVGYSLSLSFPHPLDRSAFSILSLLINRLLLIYEQ